MTTKKIALCALLLWVITLIMSPVLAADLNNAENIIVSAPELLNQAQKLAEIHDTKIPTAVVTTTWIWENYEEAGDPPYDWHKYPEVEGYNYSLAKKIISFLEDHSVHPNLKYVTLFGNAKLVPPSYYAYFTCIGSRWVPTDFFYASPDYDFSPEFVVGRIPVDDAYEAEHVINKITSLESSDRAWFRNVILAGGKPFFTEWDTKYIKITKLEFYMPELYLSDFLNSGLGDVNVTTLFLSDGNYNKDNVLKVLSGGYGVIYIDDHGGGNTLTVRGKLIPSEDILKLPANNEYSIVISTACYNGLFDEDFYKPPSWSRFYGDKSFGEALLLSNAGAIAYIGASRESYTDMKLHVENGNVVVDENLYLNRILLNVLKLYGETLGDAVGYALKEFSDSDFTNMYNRLTVFEFVLLGDPALSIESGGSVTTNPPKVAASATNHTSFKDLDVTGGIPVFEGYVEVNVENAKVLKLYNYSDKSLPLIERVETGGTYSFKVENKGIYLLRASDGGKEAWYLFYAKPAEVIKTNESLRINNLSVKVISNSITVVWYTNKPADTAIEGDVTYFKDENVVIHQVNITGLEPGDYNCVAVSKSGDEIAKAEFNFTVMINSPPSVTLLRPKDGATGINPDLNLSVFVEDPDGDELKVSFYDSQENLIGEKTVKGNGTVEVRWSGLEYGRSYEWYVIISDGKTQIKSDVWSFTTNYKPVVDFNYSIDNATVRFAASGYDPDGEIVKYEWEFGDGTYGEGAKVVHEYEEGSYTVTLTVYDDKNTSSSVSKTIVIEIQPAETNSTLPLGSKDLDGDGLYEDINGDGLLDIRDIVYFQWHYRDDDFQNYVEYYDFEKDDKIDVADVIELYIMWKLQS